MEGERRKLRLDVKECAKAAAEKVGEYAATTSQFSFSCEKAAGLIATEFADIGMDRDLSSGCLQDIGETLKRLDCCHGAGSEQHAGTPPMMYSDWIRCIVQHERNKAKSLQNVLDSAERERNGA